MKDLLIFRPYKRMIASYIILVSRCTVYLHVISLSSPISHFPLGSLRKAKYLVKQRKRSFIIWSWVRDLVKTGLLKEIKFCNKADKHEFYWKHTIFICVTLDFSSETNIIQFYFPPRTSNWKETRIPSATSSVTRHKRKAKRTTLSQQMAIGLNKSNKMRESGQTMTMIINHNRSIALERSIIRA